MLFVLLDSKALQRNNWWLKITYYDESNRKIQCCRHNTRDDIESIADTVYGNDAPL
jgi:hypothetical protein